LALRAKRLPRCVGRAVKRRLVEHGGTHIHRDFAGLPRGGGDGAGYFHGEGGLTDAGEDHEITEHNGRDDILIVGRGERNFPEEFSVGGREREAVGLRLRDELADAFGADAAGEGAFFGAAARRSVAKGAVAARVPVVARNVRRFMGRA
jgi:hypothetical protein